MTEHTVVMHRPPRPRIDYALKPRSPEPAELEHVKVLRELGARIEQERIWDLLRRSAEGCSAPGGLEQ